MRENVNYVYKINQMAKNEFLMVKILVGFILWKTYFVIRDVQFFIELTNYFFHW